MYPFICLGERWDVQRKKFLKKNLYLYEFRFFFSHYMYNYNPVTLYFHVFGLSSSERKLQVVEYFEYAHYWSGAASMHVHWGISVICMIWNN